MVTCPVCGDQFKDLRGLNGHLRFKHGLEGEELDRVYGKAKEEQREKQQLRRAPSIEELRSMVSEEVGRATSDEKTALRSVDLEESVSSDLTDLLDEYADVKSRLKALKEFKPAFMMYTWPGAELESALEKKEEQLSERIQQKLNDG